MDLKGAVNFHEKHLGEPTEVQLVLRGCRGMGGGVGHLKLT